MTYYEEEQEKPKNDEKPKNEGHKLGNFRWFLPLWVINNFRGLEGTIELQNQLNAYYNLPDAVNNWRISYLQFLVLESVVLTFAVAICCWGLWKLRLWGYNGLLVIMILTSIQRFMTPFITLSETVMFDMVLAVVSLIPLAILVIGMKNKRQYLQ